MSRSFCCFSYISRVTRLFCCNLAFFCVFLVAISRCSRYSRRDRMHVFFRSSRLLALLVALVTVLQRLHASCRDLAIFSCFSLRPRASCFSCQSLTCFSSVSTWPRAFLASHFAIPRCSRLSYRNLACVASVSSRINFILSFLHSLIPSFSHPFNHFIQSIIR